MPVWLLAYVSLSVSLSFRRLLTYFRLPKSGSRFFIFIFFSSYAFDSSISFFFSNSFAFLQRVPTGGLYKSSMNKKKIHLVLGVCLKFLFQKRKKLIESFSLWPSSLISKKKIGATRVLCFALFPASFRSNVLDLFSLTIRSVVHYLNLLLFLSLLLGQSHRAKPVDDERKRSARCRRQQTVEPRRYLSSH